MSDWLPFHEGGNALEPDISLACSEIWLSGIPPGISQADRVLIHSPMLEQAHERRFVVTEMGLDMSQFDMEHRERMESCISTLSSHFIRHESQEVQLFRRFDEEDLIGLKHSLSQPYLPQWLTLDQLDVSTSLTLSRNLPTPKLSSVAETSRSSRREIGMEADDEMELDFDTAWHESSAEIALGHHKMNVSRTRRKIRQRARASPYALPESKKMIPSKPHDRSENSQQ